VLKTPPGSSEYEMYREESADPPALVCVVGRTTLTYHLRALDDLAELEHNPRNNRMRALSVYRNAQDADNSRILVAVLIGAGFLLGLILGRWWALLACLGVGLWIGVSEEVEVPGWFLGFAYAALSALGVALGVVLRRSLARSSHSS
jgi:hypothetical protein